MKFKMREFLVSLALIACVFGEDVQDLANIEKTLEVLHVVFRHGDRTPDSLYPNDPYTEKDFAPIRIGHLTNKGKMTEYKIGQSLRDKYKAFIPDTYTPEIIGALSSHYPRTRASLELVLAGLFPPTKELTWNQELLWEPIPYDYLQASQNKIFTPATACPQYQTTYKQVSESYNNTVEKKYKNLYPFLQRASGLQKDSVVSLGASLYSTLKSEAELGMELPAWTKEVYPQILSELSIEGWIMSSQGVLKSLTSGFLVSRIVNNTNLTIQGDSAHKDTKVYLYSGHDINIAGLLLFLDNFIPPHNPNYGAHIIIEVHNISGTRYFKFLYENYQHEEPLSLDIPNCGVYCPFEIFVKLYAKHLDPKYLDSLCG